MLRIFNAVVHWAHRVYGIPEIMLEFVKIQFTETYPYKIRYYYSTKLISYYNIQLLGVGSILLQDSVTFPYSRGKFVIIEISVCLHFAP